MIKTGKWILVILAVATFAAQLRAEPRWPDTFRSRIEALALIETLNTNLLASNSATKTLEDWCAAHHMAKVARLDARLLRDVQKPLPATERQRLEIGPDEPVIYRRVDLTCGDHVLSRADNWYVPGRLTPAIDNTLETSDVPFGRAIQNLHPRRQTFAVMLQWHPLPEGWEMSPPPAEHPDAELDIPAILFEHRAVVFGGDGKPISEVDENYTRDILDFAHGE
jgi:chorismate-pyruvate lyase